MSSTNTTYLKELCTICSDKKVEFRWSPLGGLGGFAMVSIPKGDVIFAIPRDLILSSSAPMVVSDTRVAALQKDSRVTEETLLCAFLVWNRSSSLSSSSSSSSKIASYLASLPTDYTQLVPSDLEGTNVGAQLLADEQELASQLRIMQEVLPNKEDNISLKELIDARAIYNSRRYPFRFAPTATIDSSTEKSDNDVRRESGTDADEESSRRECGKKRKLNQTQQPSKSTRAVYDRTQGCLCPLLDILNHQSGRNHLTFEVTPTTLRVTTKYDIAKDEEIYSNYDCDNNDQCLLQFGFLMTSSSNNDNYNTTIATAAADNTTIGTVESKNKDPADDDTYLSLDIFTVRVGTRIFKLREHQDIPESLLGDGGYSLEQHLESKQRAQATATLSSNTHVVQYMKAQAKLLTVLLEKVRQTIQVMEAEDGKSSATSIISNVGKEE